MNSAAEWIASIPEQLTPRESLVYIQQALDDAKAATDEILAKYSGGTLPPPPWPQHAELRTAIDALDGGRLLVNQAIHLGHGDTVFPKTDARAQRLINGGRALYREIAEMQRRMKGVKVEDVPRLVFDAAKKAAADKWGGVLFFAAVLWTINNFGDER